MQFFSAVEPDPYMIIDRIFPWRDGSCAIIASAIVVKPRTWLKTKNFRQIDAVLNLERFFKARDKVFDKTGLKIFACIRIT